MSFFTGGRADQQKGRNMGTVVLQKPPLPAGLDAANGTAGACTLMPRAKSPCMPRNHLNMITLRHMRMQA
ncbi:hypothetical protein BSK56_18870 [Paenibacillus borealis]|uniref:Uncharacterized protein n=1 Tax=Paenibacillus borealis TaxID=160799 RepID=A0ABX3H6P7_PAEBO|nr:hypothetical protein BSK56_18870 [Paenibacillus borealis]